MNIKKHLLIGASCLFVVMSGLFCTTAEITGGSSGTEVSAVAGSVLNTNGTPAVHAIVKMRPSTFLIDSANSATYCSTHTVIDTITDSDGTFTISPVLPDSYIIEVIVDDTLASEIRCNIPDLHTIDTIAPVTVSPLAELNGNAQMYYGTQGTILIKPYGLDRAAVIDSNGNFTLLVPHGEHTFNIAAYQESDSLYRRSFDHMDITLNMGPGERRDAVNIKLRQAPPPPCEDGLCDSMVLQRILFETGNGSVPLDSVSEKDSTGRIISFDGHNLNFDRGLPFDITRLSALRYLDISRTRISNMFPNIGGLVNLETINVANNRLIDFSYSIGNLVNLRKIDMSNNELTSLPSSITSCSKLTQLTLSGNRLCTVDSVLSAWITDRSPDWQTSQRCQ